MKRACWTLPILLGAAWNHHSSTVPADAKAPQPLAVIVNKTSDVTGLSMEELRLYMTLGKQFWERGHRVVLLQRHADSDEQKLLLEKVYKMTAAELRKYWVAKIFAGEIPAIPSIVRSAAASIALVKKSEGAISVVSLSDVTDDVRVLSIDGKKPGDRGYPLVKD